MTYCVGWKYAGSVFFLADSAITKSSSPISPISSFGQLHDLVDGKHVEEALLKLVPISSCCVVAYSGNVALAGELIGYLKAKFSSLEELPALLFEMTINLGPFDPKLYVELIVGGAVGNISRLLYWNTASGKSTDASEIFQIGSISPFHKKSTEDAIGDFIVNKNPASMMLPVLTSIVQSYGLHANLIERKVGGTVFGISISSEQGIVWQEDTAYFLYDPEFEKVSSVVAFARDDVLVVNSSYTNNTRAFMHSVSTPDAQEWLKKWKARIVEHAKSDKFRYWVFISTAGKLITLVHRSDFQREGQYLRVKEVRDGLFDLALNARFMELLNPNLKNQRPNFLILSD